jgi:hypothetical protein
MIKEIFVRLKMGLADWDVDDILRTALQEHDSLETVNDLLQSYDKTFETAKDSKVKINKKYKHIYSITNNTNT